MFIKLTEADSNKTDKNLVLFIANLLLHEFLL